MTQISSTGRRLWCHCWEMSLVTMWMSGVSSAARVSHTVRRSQNVLGTRVSDTSFFVTYLHKISILNHFRSRLKCVKLLLFFFFFQAEDGIRDIGVTGVQTCALPISVLSYRQLNRTVLPYLTFRTASSTARIIFLLTWQSWVNWQVKHAFLS